MQRTSHHQTCEPWGGQEKISTMNQALLNKKNLAQVILMMSQSDTGDEMLSVIYLKICDWISCADWNG
jgi:hypothetical protein